MVGYLGLEAADVPAKRAPTAVARIRDRGQTFGNILRGYSGRLIGNITHTHCRYCPHSRMNMYILCGSCHKVAALWLSSHTYNHVLHIEYDTSRMFHLDSDAPERLSKAVKCSLFILLIVNLAYRFFLHLVILLDRIILLRCLRSAPVSIVIRPCNLNVLLRERSFK
jgi:hypothetical protein